MDAASAAIIGGALGAALIAVKVVGMLWTPKAAVVNGEARQLIDGQREQTAILREIKELLIVQGAEQRQQGQSQVRLEQSQAALHRRLDKRACMATGEM